MSDILVVCVEKINNQLPIISRYTEIETLDRAIVPELIDNITVSERTKVNGEWYQTIEIEYRFIGNLLNDEQSLNEGKKKEDIA